MVMVMVMMYESLTLNSDGIAASAPPDVSVRRVTPEVGESVRSALPMTTDGPSHLGVGAGGKVDIGECPAGRSAKCREGGRDSSVRPLGGGTGCIGRLLGLRELQEGATPACSSGLLPVPEELGSRERATVVLSDRVSPA